MKPHLHQTNNKYELELSRGNHYNPCDWESWSASSLLFNKFTQLGLLLHSCTSLYTSLSHASLWGSSVTQRARVLHCVDERRIQPRSSASCHDLSVQRAYLFDCNSHEGLDLADPGGELLTAFWGPCKIPGRLVQSLASCQLGGHENFLGRVTCGLRDGHGKMGPFDPGVLVQDCEKMTDAGLEGNDLA